MKKRLLPFLILSFGAFGQVQTSINNGNFFNPFNWDCYCVPGDGDSLVINHDMQLTASIYYTSGQIKINPSGSLTEDGTNRDVWVNGGSLINSGVFDCYRLYLSGSSLFDNSGTSVYFDSLWNQAAITNSGTITVYDVLNDQSGTFTNSGNFVVENNFNNQGDFLNSGGAEIDLSNDFSNCNIQSSYAHFINNGTFCIANDFTNCLDDTLSGSGAWYVGGASSNFGVFEGTFTFNTPSGALGFNSGTVDPGVNFGNSPCFLALEEEAFQLTIYPNPAHDVLHVEGGTFSYAIYDLSGKLLQRENGISGSIRLSDLASGVYLLELTNSNGNRSTQRIAKW